MQKEDEKKLNGWAIAALIISLIGLVLGIISLCRSYPRSENLGFDYIGLLVGILALLVTILIAWQIYNAIGIDARVKEAEKVTDKRIKEVEKAQAELKIEIEKIKEERAYSELEMRASIHVAQGLSIYSSDILSSYWTFFQGLEYSLKINIVYGIDIALHNLNEVSLKMKNIVASKEKIHTDTDTDTNKQKVEKECDPIVLEKYENYPLIKERYEGIYNRLLEYIQKIDDQEGESA